MTQVFPAEFDALIARLNERVFARIEEERDSATAHRESSRFPSRWQRCAMRLHDS